MQNSKKSKRTATWLAFLLGGVGAHKFYLDSKWMGLLYLVFCWTFVPLFISLIECVYLFMLSETAFDEKYNKSGDTVSVDSTKSNGSEKRAAIVTGIFAVLFITAVIIIGGNAESTDALSVSTENKEEISQVHRDEDVLPKCDSSDAKDAVKSTLEDDSTIKLLDIYNLTEASYDKKEVKRVCVGEVTLNAGSTKIKYEFWLSKSNEGEVLVAVEEINQSQLDWLIDSGQIDRKVSELEDCYKANFKLDMHKTKACQEKFEYRAIVLASEACKWQSTNDHSCGQDFCGVSAEQLNLCEGK